MVGMLESHVQMVEQSIYQLNPHHPMRLVSRSDDHRFKSNNWLKQHGEPMRRKPYHREKTCMLFLDEFGNI